MQIFSPIESLSRGDLPRMMASLPAMPVLDPKAPGAMARAGAEMAGAMATITVGYGAQWAGFWSAMMLNGPRLALSAFENRVSGVVSDKVAPAPRQPAEASAVPNTVATRAKAVRREFVASKSAAAKAAAAAVPAVPVAPAAAAEPSSISEKPARPASMVRPEDASRIDDLKLISGVGPKLEQVLNDLGIWRFEQIASWTPGEVEWVDDFLRFKGRIGRDKWIAQAGRLAKAGIAA